MLSRPLLLDDCCGPRSHRFVLILYRLEHGAEGNRGVGSTPVVQRIQSSLGAGGRKICRNEFRYGEIPCLVSTSVFGNAAACELDRLVSNPSVPYPELLLRVSEPQAISPTKAMPTTLMSHRSLDCRYRTKRFQNRVAVGSSILSSLECVTRSRKVE